jgi:hypothetical protein
MRKTPKHVKRGPGQDGLLVGLVLSIMIGWSTLAGAPEELAEQIRANVERIAALVGQQPERALVDLSEQRRQLDVLIEADPGHPAIPELDGRIGALEARLADPTAAMEAAAPPVNVNRLIDDLRARVRAAEAAMLSHDAARAQELTEALETSLADLKREHGEQIPQGHVALFVIEERLEVLKEQVAAMGRSGE